MPGACALDSLQLLCGSDSFDHGTFRNFRILACHTSKVELESTFANNYTGNTPEIVTSRETLVVSWQNNQWSGFGFDPKFAYNGSDNLILEFRWQGDDGNAAYDRGWYTPGNRAVDGRSLTAPKGTPRAYMPRLRIHYSATGVEESEPPFTSRRLLTTTIVRGELVLPASRKPQAADLLSAAGQKVMQLHTGSNDVSRLASGVYFIRGQGPGGKGQGEARKVVIE
jgi:hypothetical protein